MPKLRSCSSAVVAICLLGGLVTITGCGGTPAGSSSIRLTVAVGPAQAQTVRGLLAHGPGPAPRFVPLPAAGPAGRAAARRERIDLVVGDSEREFAGLKASGVIKRNWDSDSYFGLIATSVAAIAVRPGNPLHITAWSALPPYVRQVVLADPGASTEARAEIMGAFGGSFRVKGPHDRGLSLATSLVRSGIVRPDATAAQRAFAAGHGDVWLTTEARALAARANHVPLTIVIPSRTMELDVPIAIATTTAHRGAAQATIDALRDAPHQRLLPQYHLRPVLDGLRDPKVFPPVLSLFKISRFGGWNAVDKGFFPPCHGPGGAYVLRRARCGS